MSSERDRLLHQGQRLMHGSGESQASDLDTKVKKLSEKWKHMEETMNTREKKLQVQTKTPVFTEMGSYIKPWAPYKVKCSFYMKAS